MPELNINTKKIEVLTVNIDGKAHNIPLGSSLKRKELAKLDKEPEVMKFFEKYVGAETWNNLTINAQKQIIDGWAKATQDELGGGQSLGE